jgi:hypothetical protein
MPEVDWDPFKQPGGKYITFPIVTLKELYGTVSYHSPKLKWYQKINWPFYIVSRKHYQEADF